VLFVLPEGETGDREFLRKSWNVHEVQSVERIYPSSKWARLYNFLRNLIFRPFIPLTIASFFERKVRDKVKAVAEQKEYDVMVLDALHLAACFFDGREFLWPANVKKVVLREHNFEQELWTKAAQEETFLPLKLLLLLQKKLVSQFENRCLEKVDAIAAISTEDLKEIKKSVPTAVAEWVPLGLDFNHPLPKDNIKKGRFLFVGKLDWPPNIDGLKWFLDHVWDEVYASNPEFELQVVGSGKSDWIYKYQDKKGVILQGFIDDIDDAYDVAEYTLIPMRYGSGTRIKVIETYAKGRPTLTTKMGIQGANLDATKVPLAETAEEWISLLNNLHDKEKIERDFEFNRRRLAEQFDETQVGQAFFRWLCKLTDVQAEAQELNPRQRGLDVLGHENQDSIRFGNEKELPL